jgi:SAM-dependent methyltransferase
MYQNLTFDGGGTAWFMAAWLLRPRATMSKFVIEFGKQGTPAATADGRLDAPAFHRNAEPIWDAIGGLLTQQTGDILEIGSGTGQHAVTYAARTPELTWWPSDIYDSHLASIAAWRAQTGLANLRAPQRIDLTIPDWTWVPGGALAAMLCINVTHISPWHVTENLLAGAARFLDTGRRLLVYGPFMRNGQHTAPSNAAFDASLRAQNAEWGVRDIGALETFAHTAGLTLTDAISMPANNLMLVFTRAGRQS